MMKRSKHTNYTYEQALVYEYKKYYFVIQRGQQGVDRNPAHGVDQKPAETVALSAKIEVDCGDEELGRQILKALDDFDSTAPNFEPWENERIATQMKSWFSARSYKDIETNSRLIEITQKFKAPSDINITPFDNSNENAWLEAMTSKSIGVIKGDLKEVVGASARSAFEMSTYHPSRSDNKY